MNCVHISFFSQLRACIEPNLIRAIVGFDVNGSNEYKCEVKCPACEKIFHANYKAYAVGNRKRKADKEPNKNSRKPAWYFSSMRTHLLDIHLKDEIIEVQITEPLSDINGKSDDDETVEATDNIGVDEAVAQPIDNENIDSGCNMNENDKTFNIARITSPISQNTLFATHDEDSNRVTFANKPQTPKKNIVRRYFEQLRLNKQGNIE